MNIDVNFDCVVKQYNDAMYIFCSCEQKIYKGEYVDDEVLNKAFATLTALNNTVEEYGFCFKYTHRKNGIEQYSLCAK